MNYLRETFEYLSKLFQWWVIIQPWERGVRTRFGSRIKLLIPGIHFRIPFFDIIYIQTIRLRVVSMCPQTISTADGVTVTAVCAVGYSIADILILFNKLFQPETTICNIVQGEVADYIGSHEAKQCSPKAIETQVLEKLNASDYGIKYEYVKVVSYAIVKTYRLIQDGHWASDNWRLDEKK